MDVNGGVIDGFQWSELGGKGGSFIINLQWREEAQGEWMDLAIFKSELKMYWVSACSRSPSWSSRMDVCSGGELLVCLHALVDCVCWWCYATWSFEHSRMQRMHNLHPQREQVIARPSALQSMEPTDGAWRMQAMEWNGMNSIHRNPKAKKQKQIKCNCWSKLFFIKNENHSETNL